MKAIFAHNSHVEIRIMDGIDPAKLMEPVDNIVAINIIEHIRNDKEFIRHSSSMLNKGGRLVIFAPAFPFLFSQIDKEAGHYRRYTKDDLSDLLKSNGLELLFLHYFNFVGFWGWMLNKYTKSGVDSNTTNYQVHAFNKFVWLFRLFDVFSRWCGQSVIAVAEKP
jgi:hypothetical protein